MNRVLWLCACLSIFFLSACNQENLDITTEEEKPFEPEVVELENVLSYGLAQNTMYDDDGYGGKFLDGLYYLVSSNEIICEDNSAVVELTGEDPFVLEIFRTGDNSFELRQAYFSRVIDGNDAILFAGAFLPPAECASDIEPSITIYELTDDYMSGVFEADFYYIVPDSTNTEDCDSYINFGLITADFSVPVINCD